MHSHVSVCVRVRVCVRVCDISCYTIHGATFQPTRCKNKGFRAKSKNQTLAMENDYKLKTNLLILASLHNDNHINPQLSNIEREE